MAVTSCTLTTDGRVHEFDPDAQRSNTLVYQVRTDDPRDDGWAVYAGMLSAGPDPAPGYMARYITSGGAIDASNFARRFRFSQPRADTPTLWMLSVDFEPLPPGRDPTFTQSPLDTGTPELPDTDPNYVAPYTPLEEPPIYYTTQKTVVRIVEEDRDGNPIVNSAGQPWDEPVEEEEELLVHVIRFNAASAADVRALHRKFGRKLNEDIALGADPEHLYCLPISSGEPLVSNGVRYFPVTVRIVENDKPWRREFVNRGFAHFLEGEKGLHPATDPLYEVNDDGTTTALKQRERTSEPVLLTDGSEPSIAGERDVPGPGYRLSLYRENAVGNVAKFATRAMVNFTGSDGLPFLGGDSNLSLPT